MPAGTNTKCNIGMSRMIYSLATPALRNFEVNGQQTYNVAVAYSGIYKYTYAGVQYAKGATIPYDGTGVYLNAPQLERDFNAGLLDPSN